MLDSVSFTPENTRSYPLHEHDIFEVMLYFSGEGAMRTDRGDLPFRRGTVIIMPPHLRHGSTSVAGFRNLSVRGEFPFFKEIDRPIRLDADEESLALGKMVTEHRFEQSDYFRSLTETYLLSLSRGIRSETPLEKAVKSVMRDAERHFTSPDYTVTAALHQTGYAEDYIRAGFRKYTGCTPTAYLTDLRLENAVRMIELYQNSLSVTEIAFRSGFTDSAYFAKLFKRKTGLSPCAYRNPHRN